MRRAMVLLTLVAAAGSVPAAPPLRSKRVNAAIERIQPAVVKIYGVKGFTGVYGYMTGVILHESGLVITRNSVTIEEAPQITCHLHDGRRRTAELIRYDRRSRMALLRLLGDPGEKFPAAPLGTSAGVEAGQFVLLIGNAYKVAMGRERCAVNLGVVSAVTELRMRENTTADFEYDGPVILHDAMNNPGVFGGPLVDLRGDVIGISGTIVESKETNAQVHYAIPIDDLKPFLEDTLKNPDAGRIFDPSGSKEPEEAPEGFHGIRILRAGINRATAAYVDRVVPDSPAGRAGVRPDDLVLKIDRMQVKSWKAFDRMMSRYRAGETVQLTVKRADEIKIIPLTLEAKP
jgi:serine protease Do